MIDGACAPRGGIRVARAPAMPRKASASPDIIRLLERDHASIKALFRHFEDASDRAWKKKRAICETLKEELDLHTRLEEEVFYPRVAQLRSKDAKRLVAKAHESHAVAHHLLEELDRPDLSGLELNAKVELLRDLVLEHLKEEEKEIFPEARELGQAQLTELAAELDTRREQLRAEVPAEDEEDERAPRRGREQDMEPARE